ncbi:MAG: hypothetical protein GY702_11865 [Desulfobulbaceae bacterium]|nr:hypothetical protein [Desulfobulbaceae bacterium]
MSSQQIPWIHGYDWLQVTSSIVRTVSIMGAEVQTLKGLALDISLEYQGIDSQMEELCKKSCISCTDICCVRATVWYDLKDLLVIYLSTGGLPGRQIYRDEAKACCHLTASGCRLPRSERPFICTWYICAEQKKLLSPSSVPGPSLSGEIEKIKGLRNNLETRYIAFSS